MLNDLLVLETAAVLAGPSVGMHFAELGARVIKIENKRTGGDVTRKWKLPQRRSTLPVSAYFSSVNWGKEHRFLDLKDRQRTVRLSMLCWPKADVLITNHLAADAEKLGLARERLRTVNPRLLHGHIKGFADQPERPAFDVVLQAETGYISMTGTDADHLAKLPIALIDVLAAHQLKEGLLLALWQREQHGRRRLCGGLVGRSRVGRIDQPGEQPPDDRCRGETHGHLASEHRALRRDLSLAPMEGASSWPWAAMPSSRPCARRLASEKIAGRTRASPATRPVCATDLHWPQRLASAIEAREREELLQRFDRSRGARRCRAPHG